MRHHFYGRYGPHGWLKWHRRRYGRRLPVVVPGVSIISTERIIIIIMANPEFFEENGDDKTIDSSEIRMIGSSQDERTKIYASLKKTALFEAMTYFENVDQNVSDRGYEWPLEEAVEREALNKSNVALRPFINTSLDLSAAKQYYVETYLNAYRSLYEKKTGDGTLPYKEMRIIQQEAVRDAKRDKQDGVDVSEPELTYQAVIRIQEIIGYRTHAVTGYLTHIMAHIPYYKRTYGEERDRPARSDQFRGWQPGR